MSNAADKAQQEVGSFFSGGPGTSGREVFEDRIATEKTSEFTAGNTTGKGDGMMSSTTAPHGTGTGVPHHGTAAGGGGVGSVVQDGTGGVGVGAPGRHDPNSGTGGGLKGAVDRERYDQSGATGAGGLSGTQGHHSHEHGVHQSGMTGSDRIGQSGASKIDELTAGSGTTGISKNSYGDDRVGSMNQQGHLYERTGDQGPLTSGAAGTDRFDSDRRTGEGMDTRFGGQTEPDVTRRGEGKSSGGLMGMMATSDKDFTGRDRLGTGAYEDDVGRYKSNTDGPGGHSALTGREGNFNANPVSGNQPGRETVGAAGSGSTGAVTGSGTGPGATGPGAETVPGGHQEAHHKGFMEKVKDALT